MSRGKWINPGPTGAPAARLVQRITGPDRPQGGHWISQRTRVVVTCSGKITEDTAARSVAARARRARMTAEQNRQLFPLFAKFVDEYRRVFGPDVRVKWVREGGNAVGKKEP